MGERGTGDQRADAYVMMPLQETDEHRAAEEKCRQLVADAWGLEIRKLPGDTRRVDWDAYRNGVLVGVLEHKGRVATPTPRKRSDYDGVWVDTKKYVALTRRALRRQVPGVFIFHFADGIFWTTTERIARGIAEGWRQKDKVGRHQGSKGGRGYDERHPAIYVPNTAAPPVKGLGC